MITTISVYLLASLCEIGGCYCFWNVFRLHKTFMWLAPGAILLALFAYLLTLSAADNVGRAYAIYGGIYILSALLWGVLVDGSKADIYDVLGVAISLFGADIIFCVPR